MDKTKSPMFNVLWLQSGGCGGCSLSLLNAESPDLMTRFKSTGVNMLWHPSLSEASVDDFIQLLNDIISGETRLDALCLEGSVMQGPNGTGKFHILAGTGKPMMTWLEELAEKAQYTLAIGSCAAFGGITAAGNNAGIPVGLPTDMPKAWFVALASLSKAATPKRLKDNATASKIITPPGKQ